MKLLLFQAKEFFWKSFSKTLGIVPEVAVVLNKNKSADGHPHS